MTCSLFRPEALYLGFVSCGSDGPQLCSCPSELESPSLPPPCHPSDSGPLGDARRGGSHDCGSQLGAGGVIQASHFAEKKIKTQRQSTTYPRSHAQ